ncbi:hypothetical protein [Streptomyces sp. NPDC093109]|uniref:hypothetical protein n=1 Tax=Streptomyces sp. NPDC093109 TaxID=3154977 RepID=UPI00344FDE18
MPAPSPAQGPALPVRLHAVNINLAATHAAETPLFACRTCEQDLIVIHQRAHEPPGRRYVPARPH